MGVVLTGAWLVISVIGGTVVFVEPDLDFMRTTAAQLHRSYETLIRFRAGARWLWVALAWGGNFAFACATVVHLVVGCHSWMARRAGQQRRSPRAVEKHETPAHAPDIEVVAPP